MRESESESQRCTLLYLDLLWLRAGPGRPTSSHHLVMDQPGLNALVLTPPCRSSMAAIALLSLPEDPFLIQISVFIITFLALWGARVRGEGGS